MSTATLSSSPSRPAPADRGVPPLGGFNLTFLKLEIRRTLRNRRTMFFIVIMPAAFFLMFGLGQKNHEVGSSHVSAAAYALISLGVYGAMVATTSGGAMVSVERAQGWSRQLRLTPLRPPAYIALKVASAMVLALIAVLVDFVVGAVSGIDMPLRVWVLSGLGAWLGALVFAAFGLFMGYLIPAENVMQFLGPALGVLAMCGGLFIPLEFLPNLLATIAHFTPVYGVGEIARAPLTGDGVTMGAIANVVGWTAGFGIGAVFLFGRDTKRV